MSISEQSFLAGNYPKGMKFEVHTVDDAVWEKLERDLCEDNQIMAQSRGESTLSKEDQLKILKIVSE
jgi:hypothetical protein